jgi:23S rRNA pseudouridine955/2504/2580 synthase
MSAKAEQKVRLVEVDEASDGQRIDNFLISRLKGVPKSMVYRLLRTGQVRVNKGRKKPSYRLSSGDQVRIPPMRTTPGSQGKASDAVLDLLGKSVLFEDKALIIINKPSGMAVHGGSGVSYGIIEAFRQLRPECRFLELAHRLDRDTSGCLVLAKKRSALTGMHEMLRREHGQGIEKIYLALLKGQWKGKKRKVDAPLRVDTRKSGERHVTVAVEEMDGKQAISHFIPRKVYPNADASLVSIKLLTGRTHQARVHAQTLDMPIAGDERYGDENFNRKMRQLGLRRLFLHAARLSFTHPLGTGKVTIEAPLPEDLETLLELLT